MYFEVHFTGNVKYGSSCSIRRALLLKIVSVDYSSRIASLSVLKLVKIRKFYNS